MWDAYVDYSSSAMGHTYAMWQSYLFRAYASTVKYVYTSASGHTVGCSEFI